MRKKVLFLCFLLFSCGGATQEELNARLAQINRRIEKLEEEQKTIRAQQIKTEERVDALSQNLASLRLEVERLKVEGRTSSPPPTLSKPENTSPPQPAKVEEQPKREPPQPEPLVQRPQEGTGERLIKVKEPADALSLMRKPASGFLVIMFTSPAIDP